MPVKENELGIPLLYVSRVGEGRDRGKAGGGVSMPEQVVAKCFFEFKAIIGVRHS